MSIRYTCVPALPKLSWLAKIDADGQLVVFHGRAVECHADWMVEGVWDSDFSDGMFHRSEHFFGSGIRQWEDRIYFVCASTTQDRLLLCRDGDTTLVSNSLPLLLGHTGARLDPDHPYVDEAIGATTTGVRNYKRDFRIIHPRITSFQQVFYENIIYDHGKISFEARGKQHRISSYEGYLAMLTDILSRVRANYEDSKRRFAMKGLGTISAGYDSPAICALLRKIGITRCYTSRRSNSILPDFFRKRAIDDGTPIANILGLSVEYLLPPAEVSADEIYFLAVACRQNQGSLTCELIYDSLGRQLEQEETVGVVFNGNHGDSVWEAHPPAKAMTDQVIRGDQTGMSLMETRLKHGYVNIALPCILASNICEIAMISRSAEMAPWRIGGSYDRPIPRRILETSGVPRGMFATKKRAMVSFYSCPKNQELRKRFFNHLRLDRGLGRGEIVVHRIQGSVSRFWSRVIQICGGFRDPGKTIVGRNLDFPFSTWVWATHTLSAEMASHLQPHASQPVSLPSSPTQPCP
ncbi:MAG: hypothetical protein JWM88_1898 [Verrucomicrobia bacterium]|nr:hypothetical protein [Verrucomicrobiota bacterium]